MNKRIAKRMVSRRVIFTGGLVLFWALSFPFVVNAATAVPQPGESIRGARPRQQVSLENVDTDNKQAPDPSGSPCRKSGWSMRDLALRMKRLRRLPIRS